MSPLYVYALIDERLPRAALGTGMGRRPLSLVRAGGAFAVVEHTTAKEPTPAAIRAHDRIVRRIARLARAVLPMRFASTVATAAELDRALGAMPLRRAFERVRDAVQFTLRVSGLRSKPARVAKGAGPGTRWLTKRFAAHTVPELAPIADATRPWVRETRAERRPPRDAVAYHLVSRQNVRAWRAAFRASVPRDLDVTMTGPWPPYAFAELP